MLTCKVGENIINCFDNIYDKYQLKKWSDKNILICPDCGGTYEYCHGRVIPPYFRHKDKDMDCDGIYSEPETKEHIEGKLLLYNWLLRLQEEELVQNVKLESYILETKQRPDIYFEKDGLRNVIELQCSPIATEYLERHELYRLANINDIWILGLKKYNIKLSTNGEILQEKIRQRVIEKNTSYHLNVDSSEMLMSKNIIIPQLPYGKLTLYPFKKFGLNDLCIEGKNILLGNGALNSFIEDDIKIHKLIERRRVAEELIIQESKDLTEFLNKKYSKIYNKKCFYQNDWIYSSYLSEITFYNQYGALEFFINKKSVDCCTSYEVSIPFRGRKGGLGWKKHTRYNKLFTKEYEIVDINIIKEFICKTVSNYIRSNKYKLTPSGGGK